MFGTPKKRDQGKNVQVALDPPIRIEVQTCFETCTTVIRIVSKAGIRPSRASLESLILSDGHTRNYRVDNVNGVPKHALLVKKDVESSREERCQVARVLRMRTKQVDRIRTSSQSSEASKRKGIVNKREKRSETCRHRLPLSSIGPLTRTTESVVVIGV